MRDSGSTENPFQRRVSDTYKQKLRTGGDFSGSEIEALNKLVPARERKRSGGTPFRHGWHVGGIFEEGLPPSPRISFHFLPSLPRLQRIEAPARTPFPVPRHTPARRK